MNYALIHVADIHYGKGAPEGASSIMRAFLEDVRRQVAALPTYQCYIAFAGDIVQAGDDLSAYEAFACEMDGPLTSAGLPKAVRIVVPGNHDLSRSDVDAEFDECSRAHAEHAGVESAFNNFIETSSLLPKHFSHYSAFVRMFARCDEPFRPEGWGCRLNEDLGVYCLNTALCSFGGARGIRDERRLAAYTRDLVRWCNDNASCPVKILLHHHPLDHMNDWSATELQHIIERHFTLCLSGHNHLPEVFYSHVPQKALICTAPPLFCGKTATLAYSIVLVDDREPSAILYREYSRGTFFPSFRLAKADSGRVELGNTHLRGLREMEQRLRHALEAFKDQLPVFVEPKLSKTREFTDDPNELHSLIEAPCDTVIVAPPQFGLTCLGLHLQLEAFRRHVFWAYVDADHTKAKSVISSIDDALLHYDKTHADLKCIVLDSWDAGSRDHVAVAMSIATAYPQLPLIILTADSIVIDPAGHLATLRRPFRFLHLQALTKGAMRKLVAGYNGTQHIGAEALASHRLTTGGRGPP